MSKVEQHLVTLIRRTVMEDASTRAWLLARIREELAKTVHPASDGVCPGANPAQSTPSRPVSEGADSDRHPWVGPNSENIRPATPETWGGSGGVWWPHVAAELNRLHRAPAEAVRKERERCLALVDKWGGSSIYGSKDLRRDIANGVDP